MSDTYVWIGQDDKAEILTFEQVLQAAESGKKPKHIFLTKQELILRYQLVPKSRQDQKDTTPKAVDNKVPKDLELADDSDEKRKKRTGKAVA